MTITQISPISIGVDIPASRRLTIDVPGEVPEGRAVVSFAPAEAGKKGPGMTEAEEIEAINRDAERLNKRAMDTFLFLEDTVGGA